MPTASQRLAEYVLIDRIGAGAFGEVWRAHHHAWADRLVAIKVPTDPQFVRDLQREGAAVQSLAHPSIVKAINFDPFGEPPYLVMEYVPGENLRSIINRGKIQVKHAVAVMKQVLAALEHAHSHGLIHRDIKPENILIHKTVEKRGFASGVVKITDFGLGKALAAAGSMVFSGQQTAQIVGSQQYMPPEQLSGQPADVQADFYACGVVLFEMLTGHRPAGTEVPSDLNPLVPKYLDEVFRKAVARRERRFATAGEFTAALVAPQPDPREPVQAVPVSQAQAHFPAIFRQHAPRLGIALAAVCVVLAFVVMRVWRPASATPPVPLGGPTAAAPSPAPVKPTPIASIRPAVPAATAPVTPTVAAEVVTAAIHPPDVAKPLSAAPDPRMRLLVYNRAGTARVLRNGQEIGLIGEQAAMLLPAMTIADGDMIALTVQGPGNGNGYVRVAGLSADSRSCYQPAAGDIKDVTGTPWENLQPEQLVGMMKLGRPVGKPALVDRIAWNKVAREAPLYDSQFLAGGDGKNFTLLFAFHQPLVRAADAPPPLPPAGTTAPLDCGKGEWTGRLLLFSRKGAVQVLVNDKPLFEMAEPGSKFSPQVTIHAGDIFVFRGQAEEGVIRAGFVTQDGGMCVPLTAADYRDITGIPAGKITFAQVAACSRNAIAQIKVPIEEIGQWDKAGGTLTPRGAEFVSAEYPACYQLAFCVQERLFQPARASIAVEARQPIETRTYKFDDADEMAKSWRWKADFKMTPDGAHDARGPDNELVSRFSLDGDFAVDLNADFGSASYTNTGGMHITICGREIGFDGGWNFGGWGGCSIRVRVQRLGNEILLIRDGFALVATVPEAERNKPTHWRLWWRSRTSHIREIKVTAERIIPDPPAGP